MKNVEQMHQDNKVDWCAVISATGIRNILWRLVITWSGRPILTAGVLAKCDGGEEPAQNGLREKIGGLPVRHFGNGNREGSILQCADFRHRQKDPDH